MESVNEKKYFGYTLKQLWSCVICYCVFIAFGGFDASKSVYYPLIQEYYKLQYDYQGMLVFASCTGYTIFSLFVGYISVKLGIKSTLAIGLLVVLSTCILICIFPNIWLLLTCLVCNGVGQVFLDVGTNTWATIIFNAHKAVMMNLLHCFYGLGASIGPILTAYVSRHLHFDYRGVFIGILILITFALIMVLFSPSQKKEDKQQNESSASSEQQQDKQSSISICSAFKHPVVLLLGIVEGCIAGTENITMNWAPIYLRDLYGWDVETKGAHFISIFFLCYTLSRVVSGFIIDAVGEVNSVLIYTALLIVVYILGFCIYAQGPYILMFTGVFIAPLFPTTLTVAMEYFGEDCGKITCVLFFIYMVFSQTMQYVVGVVSRYIGVQWGYRVAVLLMVIVFINIYIVKILLKKKQQKQQEALLPPEVNVNSNYVVCFYIP